MATTFEVNGRPVTSNAEPDTPLLWVLRDDLSMTGTKYGCGIAQCGACTVLMNGDPVPACTITIDQVDGQSIQTIEGLSSDRSHPVQRAWAEVDVPQCGYCQSGQILTAVALLNEKPTPTDADINSAMDRVLCRCGTYPRIKAAIKRAAELSREG